jgi:hypothetical protein
VVRATLAPAERVLNGEHRPDPSELPPPSAPYARPDVLTQEQAHFEALFAPLCFSPELARRVRARG